MEKARSGEQSSLTSERRGSGALVHELIEGRIIGGRWRFRRADLDAFFANAPRNWDFAGKDGDRN